MGNLLRIGLTGGIGSGKSTACKIFSDLGTPVIDADEIGRQLTCKGQPVLRAIAEMLGNKAVTTDGNLDRDYLRQYVFNDDNSRQILENILHPLIYNEIERQASLLNNGYCIICIPLLIETRGTGKVDRVLVIDVPEDQQILRASHRDNSGNEIIKKIMRAQASRADRLSIADDVIHNDGDVESLKQQIYLLDKQYKKISAGCDQHKQIRL